MKKKPSHKILVFRDHDTTLRSSYGSDVSVGRAVTSCQIKRVNGVMPRGNQFARETARQLRVHDELHAANGSMRLTWLRRAP